MGGRWSRASGVGGALLPLGEPGRVRRGFGAAAHPELAEEVGDVVLDGLLGEEHLLADLAVGETVGDQREDLALLVGEAGELVVGLAVADPLEDPAS